jgi:RimJ/RimL family protein N-acetyltransferase
MNIKTIAPTYLESDRLILKEFTADQSHHLLDLDSDPDVMRYLTDGKPSSPADIEAMIKRVNGYFEKFNHKFGMYTAYVKSTGHFIGWFLLRPDKKDLDNVLDLEIGYRFKKAFWGNGYATEVSLLLRDKAFQQFGARTVFAYAMEKNNASTHVMKKAGLTFHSRYIEQDFPGVDKNAVKYVITRSEWESLKSL